MKYTLIKLDEALKLEKQGLIKIYATDRSGILKDWHANTAKLNEMYPSLTEVECIRDLECEYLIEKMYWVNENTMKWEFAYGKKI